MKCLLLTLLLALGSSLFCNADTLDEKAARYHAMLLKRPKPGTLFERFESAWLETGSISTLRDFLAARTKAADATPADLMLQGFFLSQQNEHEAAVAAFAQALAAAPNNADAWLHRAQAETRQLDFDAALKSLANVKEDAPGDVGTDAIKLRARLLSRIGESAKSLEALQTLAQNRLNDEDLQDDIIEVLIQEGLQAEALAALEALVARTKDPYLRVLRRLRLGDIHQRADRRDEALSAYAACLADAAQDSWIEGEVLAQIEQVFRRKDDLVGLRAHLEKLSTDHPQRVAVGTTLVKVLTDLKESDAALAIQRGLLERNPGVVALLDAHADLLDKLGKQDEAIQHVQALVERRPQDKELRIRLATLFFRAHKPGEAGRVVKELIAGDAVSEFEYLRAARMFESFDDPAEAKHLYQLAETKHPESALVKEALATFQYAHNDKQSAIRLWSALAKGEDKDIALRAVRALLSRGEASTALDLLVAQSPPPIERPRLVLMIQAATSAKRLEEARGWARELLIASSTADMLEEALRITRAVYRDADASTALLKDLQARPALTLPERAMLAELHEEQGDADAAVKALAAVTDANDIALAKRMLARLYQRRQDYDRATSLLTEVIALPNQRKPDHLELLAKLHLLAHRPADALKVISDWKALQPSSTRPWIEEAKALRADDRAPQAVEVLRAAAHKFDQDIGIAAALASAYAQAGQLADAQRIYTDLFEKAEDSSAQLRWVGQIAQIAQERGQMRELVERFQERQRGNRQSVSPWLALAEIHRQASNYEARRNALLEAARLRPKDVDLLHQIARVEESEGDWQHAVSTLEQAATLDKTAKSRERLAELHLAQGDEETGMRIIVELSGGDQMNPRTAESMALSIMGNDNFALAQRMLDPVLQRFPEDYRLRTLYAIALLDLGRTDAAIDEFVALTAVTEELPGVTPSARDEERQYIEWPPGVEPLAPIAQFARGYTQYARYFAEQRSASGRSGAGQSPWILPATVKHAPSLAAAHLLELSKGWTHEKRSALAARTRDAGFTVSHVFTDFVINESNGSLDVAPELLKAGLKEPLAAAWWLTDALRLEGDQSKTTLQQLRDARAILAKDFTSLAFLAAVQSWRLTPTDTQAAREAAQLLEHTNVRHNTWLSYAATLLRALPEHDISSAEGRALLDAMIAWHGRRIEAQPKMRSNSQWWIAFLHSMRRDWKQFYAVIDKECRDWQQKEAVEEALQTSLRSPSYGNIEPLKLPLDDLYEVPSWILPWAAPDFIAALKLSPAEQAEFKSASAKLSVPIVKAAFLRALGDDAAADEVIATRAKANDATAHELMTAAAMASQQSDHVQALAVLARTRAKSNGPAERFAVDSAITYAALQLSKADQTTDLAPHMEIVRKSALAMRQLMAGSGDTDSLADALTVIGLEAEGQRLRLLAKQRQSTSSPSSGSNSMSPYEFTEMLESGKQKDAIAGALRELRTMANDMLTSSRNGSFYNLHEWTSRIAKAHMADEIWKAAMPPGTLSFKQKAQMAMIALILERWKDAHALLQECITTRPRDAMLRFHLAGALLHSDAALDGVLKSVLEVDKRDQEDGGSAWVDMVGQTENLAFRIRLADFATAYIEHWAASPKGAPVWWTTAFSDKLTESISVDEGADVPDLFAAEPPDTDSAPDPDLLKRRREAYERLTAAQMKHPLLGIPALSKLAALKLHEGADIAALATTAKTLMPSFAQAINEKGNYKQWAQGVLMGTQESRREDQIMMPSVVDLLLMDAWKQKQPQRVESEVLPLVKQVIGTSAEGIVKAKAALYFCPEAEFGAAVTAWVATLPRSYNEDTVTELMQSEVLRVWSLRGLKSGIAALCSASYDRLAKQGRSLSEDLVRPWLKRASKAGEPGTVRQCLEAIAAAYLGPQAEWPAYVQKHRRDDSNARYNNESSPTWRVAQVTSLLEDLNDDHELYPAVIRVAKAMGLQGSPVFHSIVLPDFLTESPTTLSTSEWAALAEELGFFEDMETLDPLSTNRARPSSVLAAVTMQMERPSHRQEWITLTGERRQRTPTLGLWILSRAADFHVITAFDQFLADRGQAFAQLPLAQRQRVMLGLSISTEGYNLPATRYERKPELAPYLTALKDISKAEFDKVIKATSLKDLGVPSEGLREWLFALLRQHGGTAPDAAAGALLHLGPIILDHVRRQGWEDSDLDEMDDGWNIPSQLLYLLSRPSDRPSLTGTLQSMWGPTTLGRPVSDGGGASTVAISIQVLTDPANAAYSVASPPHSYGWGLQMVRALSGNGFLFDIVTGTDAMFAPYAPHWARGSAMLATAPCLDLFSYLQPWQIRLMENELRKDPAKAIPADVLKLALTLGALSGWNGDALRRDAELSTEHRAALDIAQRWLDDGQTNVQVRQAFAGLICEAAKQHTPTPFVHTALALMSESLELKRPLYGPILVDVLNAFNAQPKTPASEALSKRFCAAWLARCANDATSDQDRGQGFWPEDNTAVAALETFAIAGDASQLARLLKLHSDTFDAEPGAALVLSRHGFPKLARPIIERIIAKKGDRNFANSLTFTAQDEAALPAMIEAMNTPFGKTAARVLLGSAIDARTPGGHGWQSTRHLDQRLADAVPTLLELGDQHVPGTDVLMWYAATSRAASAALIPWHERELKLRQLRRKFLSATDSDQLNDLARFVGGKALQQALNGDAKAWTELVNSCRTTKSDDDAELRREQHHSLATYAYNQARIWIRDQPAAKGEVLASIFEPFIAPVGKTYESVLPVARMMRDAGLALANKLPPESLRRGSGLPSQSKPANDKGEVERVLYGLCLAGADNRSLRPLDERLRVITSLCEATTQSTHTMLYKWRRPLQLCRKLGILTGDEIRQNADALAKAMFHYGVIPDVIEAFDEAGQSSEAVKFIERCLPLIDHELHHRREAIWWVLCYLAHHDQLPLAKRYYEVVQARFRPPVSNASPSQLTTGKGPSPGIVRAPVARPMWLTHAQSALSTFYQRHVKN